MPQHDCPLCHIARDSRKFKPLYGTPVCKKCYNKFASRRQFAYIVDSIVFQASVYGIGAGIVTLGLAPAMSAQTADVFSLVAGYLVFPLIFFCKDGFAGYSPGKFLFGVRAIDPATLAPIGFASSFKRNLPLLIPFMVLVMAFLLQKGHRVGDGWAHSKVIWKKYANHPVFTGLFACEVCQYDLRGNTSSICPECGTPIPGSNPTPRCTRCDHDLTGNTSGHCPGCGAVIPPPIAPPVISA